MTLLRISNSDIEAYIKDLEAQAKDIKEEIFRISWYMRGGVTSEDLFHRYSYEDRMIIGQIIKENINATKASGISLV